MISWALCFESNFCIIIILYDTLFFLFFSQKKGQGRRGYHKFPQFGMIY